jgi:hypothetical protein
MPTVGGVAWRVSRSRRYSVLARSLSDKFPLAAYRRKSVKGSSGRFATRPIKKDKGVCPVDLVRTVFAFCMERCKVRQAEQCFVTRLSHGAV